MITIQTMSKGFDKSYQAGIKFSPRLDEDLVKELAEVSDYLEKEFHKINKMDVFRYLLKKGYEQWKKENKS